MKPTIIQNYVLYPVYTLLQWLPLGWLALFYTYYLQMAHHLGTWAVQFKHDPGIYSQTSTLLAYEDAILLDILFAMALLIPAGLLLN